MNKSKIVYIKGEKYFLYDGKTLTSTEAKSAKRYFTALGIDPSALYLYTQKLPSSLNDEQVSIKMDINMYEEGGADEEKEYTTSFIRTPLPAEDNDLVDLFGLTDEQANMLYGDMADKTGAIDLITPSVMAYQCLHEPENEDFTDIYLYFGDEEAYGAIYSNGEYVTHRNLENLARVSALCGWDLDVLKAALKARGLNEIAYEESEIQTLSIAKASIIRSIEKIIHTLNHKKGLFKLKGKNRIFIDFEGDTILGLELIFASYDIEVDAIKPIKINNNKEPLLNHDLIVADYLLGVANNRYKNINLSPFEREKPLHKRPSGHLLMLICACILALFGINYAYNSTIESKDNEINHTQNELEKARKTTQKIAQKVKSLRKEKKELEKEYALLDNKNRSLTKSKQAVPYIYSSILQRQQMMDDTLMGLSKNGLGATRIEQNSSKAMKIYVIASPDKQEKIANFMDYMSERGYQKSFTNKIDNNESYFKSVVEIIR